MIIILVLLMILVLKMNENVSHNMILMPKYKGEHGGKKGQKIRARPSPPPFRAMPERNRFFLWEVLPKPEPYISFM